MVLFNGGEIIQLYTFMGKEGRKKNHSYIYSKRFPPSHSYPFWELFSRNNIFAISIPYLMKHKKGIVISKVVSGYSFKHTIDSKGWIESSTRDIIYLQRLPDIRMFPIFDYIRNIQIDFQKKEALSFEHVFLYLLGEMLDL